jgi:hypothetical protein
MLDGAIVWLDVGCFSRSDIPSMLMGRQSLCDLWQKHMEVESVSRAKRLLASLSLKTRFGQFMPTCAYPTWQARQMQLKSEYFAEISKLLEGYQQRYALIREDMQQDDVVESHWRALGNTSTPTEAFRWILGDSVFQIPPIEACWRKVYWNVLYSELPTKGVKGFENASSPFVDFDAELSAEVSGSFFERATSRLGSLCRPEEVKETVFGSFVNEWSDLMILEGVIGLPQEVKDLGRALSEECKLPCSRRKPDDIKRLSAGLLSGLLGNRNQRSNNA